jgi:hypothetical protein
MRQLAVFGSEIRTSRAFTRPLKSRRRAIATRCPCNFFSPLGVRNKNEIARFIAARFPELARSLPPERKPWMSEDSRMAIFDAAALAFASFGLAGRELLQRFSVRHHELP